MSSILQSVSILSWPRPTLCAERSALCASPGQRQSTDQALSNVAALEAAGLKHLRAAASTTAAGAPELVWVDRAASHR